MNRNKKCYHPLRTERGFVMMENGFCAASDVVKKDETKNGDVSINEQGKGADGTEFEIEF